MIILMKCMIYSLKYEAIFKIISLYLVVVVPGRVGA